MMKTIVNEEVIPNNIDFLDRCARVMPISLHVIRAKECQIFAKYKYKRPILDIGCGEGEFAKILFDEKIDVGIDINKKNVNKAIKSGAYKKCYVSASENIEFNEGYFKSIISNCVLEHVSSMEKTLDNVYKILDDDGIVYFTVATDKFSRYFSFSDYFYRFITISEVITRIFDKVFNHNFAVKKQEWDKMFDSAGFEILYDEPYLSRTQLHIMGIYLIFSFPSFIWKKIFNKWRIFPKFYRNKRFIQYLRNLNFKECFDGGCHFYKLRKKRKEELKLEKIIFT